MDGKLVVLGFVLGSHLACGTGDPAGLAAPSDCPDGIFRPLPDVDGALAELSSDRSVVRARLVEPALDSIREGERLELNLFDDVCLHALREALDTRGAGSFVWNGRIEGVAESRVILVGQEESLVGSVTLPGKLYQVRPLSSGVHAAIEVDASAFPPEAPPVTTSSVPR